MLMDHADPVADGRLGVGKKDRLALDIYRPGVGKIYPREAVHKRSLAGAVLSEYAVHLAGEQFKIDALVGVLPVKNLIHATH
ncbi:hypothetical protein SDC9_207683 [bioreactor metagenome]|uniref:Uncharacterized protein n=1 Tax=bioreactor metagenome TaxID=1076179 RepID=A0A645J9Y3_9ZZZZ